MLVYANAEVLSTKRLFHPPVYIKCFISAKKTHRSASFFIALLLCSEVCGLDLLVLDDFLLHTLTDEREVKLLFEILEKRSEMKLSTFICSQRDPKSWSAMILNDEVSANAILKRATKHFTVLIRPKSAT